MWPRPLKPSRAWSRWSKGTRPLRTRTDPSRDGSEIVSAVADRVRADFFRRIGLDSLLTAGRSL
ncbi:short-chain dehydrogenase/reductase [Streptomyces qinglanensis]|uniref:Uncharacterized protein n=1 Tax=Streptomyces qinglanensis TaxID=943816 RepID=A0A1H9WP56_9ACTN|nr:short-chain dehydrogenase/reductase [Streptomyces qinglanensis]SES35702.1 hypothetical protein SAMN05421870_11962 [Streptomyces qinglanensis]